MSIIAPATFDPSKVPSNTHPKSVSYRVLNAGLSQYYSTLGQLGQLNDGRDVSPQFRAFEATFFMNANNGKAPVEDGKAAYSVAAAERAGYDLCYRIPVNPSVNIEPVKYNGVQCYWLTYPHQKSWKEGKFLVYFHGGCFMFGNIYTHSGVASHICKQFDLPLLFVEYSLCPEKPFPAARNDTLSVHKALLQEDPNCYKRMITYGESAGGALSIMYVQNCIEQKLPNPALAIAISPWADVTCDAASYTENELLIPGKEIMMSREQGKWYSAQGVGGLKRMQQENIDLSQGIYSCYNGVFQGFCPLYMVCGAAELLATDSKLVYEKAKAAGVDVTCVSQPFMCHNFANFGELFPEATRALEKVITWSKQKLP